jgi:hypothetical protein
MYGDHQTTRGGVRSKRMQEVRDSGVSEAAVPCVSINIFFSLPLAAQSHRPLPIADGMMRLLELRWAIGRDYQPTRPRGMEAWCVAAIKAGREKPIVIATRAACQIGRVRADSNATALVGSGRRCATLRMCGGLCEVWKASDTVSLGNIQWVQPPASIPGPVHYATSMRPTTNNAKSYAPRSRFYGHYKHAP